MTFVFWSLVIAGYTAWFARDYRRYRKARLIRQYMKRLDMYGKIPTVSKDTDK